MYLTAFIHLSFEVLNRQVPVATDFECRCFIYRHNRMRKYTGLLAHGQQVSCRADNADNSPARPANNHFVNCPQKSAVRLHKHRILSPTERPWHFSTLGTMETGRNTTVDIRHTLTQFGDWSGPSRPLSSACAQGIVVWVPPSEEDWHFRHFPLWVRTSWPNPRPRSSVLPKLCRETSANMAAGCWSGDQAVGLGRRPLPDGWFCGINRTDDLYASANRWRRRRRS